MNTKTLKGLTAAASLLIGIGAASPALATTTGQQALGVVLANGIDVWTFTCGPATLGAVARVLDNGPNNAPAADASRVGRGWLSDCPSDRHRGWCGISFCRGL